MYPTVEKELLNYVQIKQAERIAVTASMIGRKARELRKTLDIQDAKFSSGWTQHAQKLPEDMLLVVKEFLQTSREKTKDIEKKFIIPFDETPMWFDMPRNTTIDFEGVRQVSTRRCGDSAPCANMIGDLMISTYIPQVIRARLNGFFKSKGIIFVDRHRSHVHNDVVKALKMIPGGTTCVLQLPDVLVNKPFKNSMTRRWEKWMDEGKGGFTKKENRKKASYELVWEWVSETWREISTDLLARSFEAAGLMLNPNGSEDDKMTSYLRAIIANRINEVCFFEEENNESSNQDSVDNESNLDDEFGDELYSKSATDDDSEDMIDIE
ncbi:24757_t:CDS:2 [Dentiscutata erythropus]|uniref:24757_t:CDS:1 n=1 Tax=Dentiscutata erythropus TaxID=1348616 RepID=A0A9N9P819_9GLOM|nr:24757_t:CDS:2 [Dentiscutata erythropus]